MRTGKKVEFWWPVPSGGRNMSIIVHLSNRRNHKAKPCVDFYRYTSHMLSRLVGESVVETQSFEWISFIFLPPTHFEMTTTLSVLIL